MLCAYVSVRVQARLGTDAATPADTPSSSQPSQGATSTQDRATAKLQLTVAQRMKEAGTLASTAAAQ